MRLLLEISHMRNASPATASRGGVLFLNESDVGWRPYVQTWVDESELVAADGAQGTIKLLLEQARCFRRSVTVTCRDRRMLPRIDRCVILTCQCYGRDASVIAACDALAAHL